MTGAAGEAGRDPRIEQLKEHVAEMARLSLEMVQAGVRAFRSNDPGLANHVVELDEELDRRDVDLESETIRLIAVLQPEGADLRLLGAVLKIATSVDRVGRLGYDLARLQSSAPEPSDPRLGELLERMDAGARRMVELAIAAFLAHDAEAAKRVLRLDDEVDSIHREIQRRLVDAIVRGGPSAERLAGMLLAARHLERVGDNACKIAEKTVYAVTGERRPEYFPTRRHAAHDGAARAEAGPAPPATAGDARTP